MTITETTTTVVLWVLELLESGVSPLLAIGAFHSDITGIRMLKADVRAHPGEQVGSRSLESEVRL